MQFNENNSSLSGGRSRLQAKLASPAGEVVSLLLLVLAAFFLRYVVIPPYQVIAADGPSYASISRQIFEHFSFTSSIHYPPLYPMLLGLANLLLHDQEAAGIAVSLFMGSLLPVPVYLLGRGLYGRGTGYVAAALTLAWPEFVFHSSTVLAYSTYFTLLMTGMYLLWMAHTRKTVLPAVGSGIFVAAAYLSRQEAFISMFAVCGCLAAMTLYRERSLRGLQPLMVAFGVFVAAILPYIIMVHQVMGIWTLAGKSVVTLTDCLGYYLKRPDFQREPGVGKIGILDLVRHYPGYFPYTFRQNFAELRAILPTPMIILAVIGLISGSRLGRGGEVRAFILGSLSPVIVLLTVFIVSGAYVAPYLPIVFIMCGHGLISLERGIVAKFSRRRAEAGNKICWLTALLVSGYVGWQAFHGIPWKPPQPYQLEMDSGRYDQKIMGRLLKKYLPPGALIMTRSVRIAFYSGHPWVDIPQADLDTILRTAREKKVRYLIVTGELEILRPQMAVLLQPILGAQAGISQAAMAEEVLPGLVRRMIYDDPASQGMVVYEFVR